MKSRAPILLAVLCAIVFALGCVELFRLRFEAGDVYPPYSSLRADPLGTMAFYESLERLPGLRVERDFRPTNVIPEAKDTIYLHLAAGPWQWRWVSAEQFNEMEAFLRRGGRLVVTFFPQTSEGLGFLSDTLDDAPGTKAVKQAKGETKKAKSPEPKKKTPPKKSPKKTDKLHSTSLKERWGVELGFEKLSEGDGGTFAPVTVTNRNAAGLPPQLDWHSGAVLKGVTTPWRVLYARGTNAVMIERKFGDGSIVMATDSYFLSNEALRKERHPDLLAWLIGSGRTVVFDEAHFGILEGQGVATLIRKYRLFGCAAGLLMLALLFIWKNSVSFVPPHGEARKDSFVAGRPAAAGFVNLLRRNIAARDLLNTCFAEWSKMPDRVRSRSVVRQQQVQAAMDSENAQPARNRDPLGTYRNICRMLKRSEFRVSSFESTLSNPQERKASHGSDQAV